MKRRRFSLARAAMKLLCILLGLILVVMLGVTLYFQHLMGITPFAAPDTAPVLSYTEQSSPTSTVLPETLEVTLSNQSQSMEAAADNGKIGGTGSSLVNILLIGQDAREGEVGSRSDSMILCTFNKDNKQLIMTSFLRDLYVPIPGYGSNRINAAYAFGGKELLNQTLEENFSLHIDGNVEVDFGQFSGIIDLMGGVDIELRQDEANVINQETGSTLESGLQHLNGQQALAFARIRKLDADGDFSRTSRQRLLMETLWNSYRSAGSGTLLKLLSNVIPMLSTDMSNGQILGYALSILPSLKEIDIVSQRIPADGQYTDKTIDGMSVLAADLEAATRTLRTTLTGS